MYHSSSQPICTTDLDSKLNLTNAIVRRIFGPLWQIIK